MNTRFSVGEKTKDGRMDEELVLPTAVTLGEPVDDADAEDQEGGEDAGEDHEGDGLLGVLAEAHAVGLSGAELGPDDDAAGGVSEAQLDRRDAVLVSLLRVGKCC